MMRANNIIMCVRASANKYMFVCTYEYVNKYKYIITSMKYDRSKPRFVESGDYVLV